MKNVDIRLAAIYELSNNRFTFFTAALVKYNKLDDSFQVLTSDLSGALDTVFYRIDGSQDYVIDYSDLTINEEINESKDFGIFIFEPDYIKKRFSYSEDVFEDKEIFYELIREAWDVEMVKHSYSNNKFYSYPLENDYESLTEEAMDQMIISSNIELSSKDKELLHNYLDDVIYHSEKELQSKLELYNKIKNKNDISDADINIDDIIKTISDKIVGQEEAIMTLVTNISFIQKLIDHLDSQNRDASNELDSRKPAILLDGSTGTGKTAIAKEIAKIFKLPLVIVNANSFSETGYVGPTITDILNNLLNEAQGDLELASRGIVVIDEVDKLAEKDYQSKSVKLGVQSELLGFMSGSTYEIKKPISPFSQQVIDFDTSRLTFILSGAFTDIKEKKIQENERKGLGFNSDRETKDRTYTITTQDYIDYGLMKEFFGRIKILTTTKTYSVEDLKTILLNSTISPLKSFIKTCNMYGYTDVIFDNDFIDAIANKAYEMGTGARALQNLMLGIQDILLLDIMCNDLDVNKPIVLNVGLLEEYQKRNIRTY